MQVVSDAERRARLAVRHALAQPVADPLAAASAVVCLHATEPSSVYLSSRARCGASRADIDRALYSERTIVRQLAMRRTVFAFPRDVLPAVRGSAAARIAAQQAKQLAGIVVTNGIAEDGDAWVKQTSEATLALLHEGPATTAQLRKCVAALQERITPPERRGAAPTPVASRMITVLAAGGSVVRGMNNGGWKTSRPIWTVAEDWLGSPTVALTEAEGYAELVSRWLWAFGPGTEDDITWWLGAKKTAVRSALSDLGALAVQLEDGSPAWLHPDEVNEVPAVASWAALLPALDPTTMGWRGRDFYIDEHKVPLIYDRAGNGRPTAWWNGRIVGGWMQEDDGTVVVLPISPLPKNAIAALQKEAKDLTEWLNGDVIRSSMQSPLIDRALCKVIR